MGVTLTSIFIFLLYEKIIKRQVAERLRQRRSVSIFCWSTNFNLNDYTVAHLKIFRFLNAHFNGHKISAIFGEQGSLSFSFANPYVGWDPPSHM